MFSRIFYIFVTLVVLIAQSTDAAVAQPAQATIHYDLALRLLPIDHRIEGTASLELPRAERVEELQLDGVATVRTIKADDHDITFIHSNDRLILTGLRGKQVSRLVIGYAATFNDPLPRETIGIEDPSFGVSASISTEGVFLANGVAWFPQIKERSGTHRLQVTAPSGTVAVTAGRFTGTATGNGATVSTWENNFPLTGLALAAGPYQVREESYDGIQLLTFFTEDNAALAPGYLAAVRRHLAFYRELLGSYPFPKFAVVENFLPTGYGLPSWTLIGRSVIRLPFLLDTSLPHEIVHAWWGNAVEVDYARGNWAEGLATYLADYLIKERDNAMEADEYRRKILRDYASLVTPDIDFPLTAFRGRAAKYQQAVGYGKGAMVFHMLRRESGDQLFWAGLRTMAAAGNGATLGWRDIERIFSTATGRDLRWFFQQWVEQAGAPELSFDGVLIAPAGSGWRVTGVVRQTEPGYRIDLPLRITGAGGRSFETMIRLGKGATRFAVDVPFPPESLTGDPDIALFRRLAAVELPATVNDLLTPRRPLVIVANGRAPLLNAATDLLKGLHWEHADIVSEAQIAATSLTGRDVLLLGWPSRPELQPQLPATLTADGQGCLQWQHPDSPPGSETLFTVLVGQTAPAGVRALLCSSSAEMARPAAAKIAHYGRYSLLLFSAGRNLAKTTWQPATSPLAVNFTGGFKP